MLALLQVLKSNCVLVGGQRLFHLTMHVHLDGR